MAYNARDSKALVSERSLHDERSSLTVLHVVGLEIEPLVRREPVEHRTDRIAMDAHRRRVSLAWVPVFFCPKR